MAYFHQGNREAIGEALPLFYIAIDLSIRISRRPMRLSNLNDWLPFHRPEDLATFAEGLRIAGMPE